MSHKSSSINKMQNSVVFKYSIVLACIAFLYGIIWYWFGMVPLSYLNLGFVGYFAILIYLIKKNYSLQLTSNLFAFGALTNLYIMTIILWTYVPAIFSWYIIVPFASLIIFPNRQFLIWTIIGIVAFIFIPFIGNINDTISVNFNLDESTKLWLSYISSFTAIIVSFASSIFYKQHRDAKDVILNQQKDEITIANHKLIETQKYKERFFANISHEIRTPLNAIVGVSELLENSKEEKEKQELISILHQSSTHLKVLINDMLDYSKIQENKLKIKPHSFSLQEIITGTVELSKFNFAGGKDLEITVAYDTKIPETIIGDSTRVFQIVLNLLSNAFKFTDAGEISVLVSLLSETTDSLEIQMEITDTGIGISEEHLESIFLPYYQAHEGWNYKHNSTGLGLSVVQGLVELLQGKIDCKSTQGVGTSFQVILPFQKTQSQESNLTTPTQKPVKESRPLEILIVDDSEINCLVAKKIISKEIKTANIKTVFSGQSALDTLRNQTFDLILMDIMMPEMDGLETTEIIRKEINPNIPIVALSANISEDTKKTALEIGMKDYLQKPVDSKKLISAIYEYTQN